MNGSLQSMSKINTNKSAWIWRYKFEIHSKHSNGMTQKGKNWLLLYMLIYVFKSRLNLKWSLFFCLIWDNYVSFLKCNENHLLGIFEMIESFRCILFSVYTCSCVLVTYSHSKCLILNVQNTNDTHFQTNGILLSNRLSNS